MPWNSMLSFTGALDVNLNITRIPVHNAENRDCHPKGVITYKLDVQAAMVMSADRTPQLPSTRAA